MQRREFLKLLGTSGACIAVVGCQTTTPNNNLIVPRKNNKLVISKHHFTDQSGVTVVYKNSAIGVIKLDEQRFSASLLICSHRGCTVALAGNKYVCPCHEARFDESGRVLQGPAEQNLTTFITSSDTQAVYIHLP